MCATLRYDVIYVLAKLYVTSMKWLSGLYFTITASAETYHKNIAEKVYGETHEYPTMTNSWRGTNMPSSKVKSYICNFMIDIFNSKYNFMCICHILQFIAIVICCYQKPLIEQKFKNAWRLFDGWELFLFFYCCLINWSS